MSRFSRTVISLKRSRPSGAWMIPPRAIAAGVTPRKRAALAPDVAAIGQQPRDGVEQRRLAGAVEADHGDELAAMHVQRRLLQRRRAVVGHVDGVDFEERRLRVGKRGFRPLGRGQRAAEIDPPHRLVVHHRLRLSFRDALADIHGEHAVGERGDALDVVVDDQHRPPVAPHLGDQLGENSRLARGEPGEGLVDQHDLGLARDRLGKLDAPEIRERQRRGQAVENAAQADPLGDFARAPVDGGIGP